MFVLLAWLGIILGVFLVLFVLLFFAMPDRAKDFLGSLSATAHSLAGAVQESKGKRRRRRVDAPPPDADAVVHRRPTPHPTGFMTIRAFAIPPHKPTDDPSTGEPKR